MPGPIASMTRTVPVRLLVAAFVMTIPCAALPIAIAGQAEPAPQAVPPLVAEGEAAYTIEQATGWRDEMLPLVETMYWSCPTTYTSGKHWELSRPRWKAIVESWGCNDAGNLGSVRWAVLAAALAWSCGFR